MVAIPASCRSTNGRIFRRATQFAGPREFPGKAAVARSNSATPHRR
jgi:hypothetical protein